MKRITIYRECPVCFNEIEIELLCSDHEHNDYNANYKGLIIPKKAIQDIFPNLDTVTRESIKSGICAECQKAIF